MPGSWISGTSTPAHTREPTPMPKVPRASSLEYPYGVIEPVNQDMFLVEQNSAPKDESPTPTVDENYLISNLTSPTTPKPTIVPRPPSSWINSPASSPPRPTTRVVPKPTTGRSLPRTSQGGNSLELAYESPQGRGLNDSETMPESLTSNTNRSANVYGNANTERPIVIAVFGQTGTGKTSLIKAVTGEDLEIGHSLTSCKFSHCSSVPFIYYARYFSVDQRTP